ncbi:hypothetical protein B0A50_04312 [Salinomyces thailandicus]|uniref:Wax synthase domain-containing protein n=1 Tax=Salinomyces thailandicus TaxID=706561 RepID=A0A4U0TXX2_9PEZI|nr:hypothetical protein B0A50_04312 [Salinomyces thailandica]
MDDGDATTTTTWQYFQRYGGQVILAPCLYVQLVYYVAWSRATRPPYSWDEQKLSPQSPSALRYAVPVSAILAASCMLLLPMSLYEIESVSPLWNAGLRVVCFFYACKSLDLGVARRHDPPTRLVDKADGTGTEPAPLQNSRDISTYARKLATEMRYHSFDIAAKQKDRPETSNPQTDLLWTLGPIVVLPTLTYLIPISALKCATLLLVIQLGLEALHKLVHLRCPHPLFWRPWAARTMSDFWTTHWHSAAAPFLYSLAYAPTKRLLAPLLGKQGGRAAGVLAAFSLSGVWHGWASAPAVTRPWLLGFQVWALFMGFGVASLVERWVWGKRQGGWVQRGVVWSVALGGAGVCARTLECYCRVEWVRRTQCPA